MKLRIISDIHIEFSKDEYNLPVIDEEHDQILVIAGDLAPINSPIDDFIDNICERFKEVIMVMGNHEFYYNDVLNTVKFDEYDEKYSNFHFLENSTVIIDDVLFMGCPLWTTFNDHDPDVMNRAFFRMGDFRHINYNGAMFGPEDWLSENKQSREFLWDALDSDLKKVVVTHHLPSNQSITDSFYYTRGKEYTYCYCSDDMGEWLKKADLWIHGHVHNSIDYVENGCRVVSNPRGYLNIEQNDQYDPNLIIEV